MEYDADKNKTSVIMDNSTFVSRQGKEGLRLKPILHNAFCGLHYVRKLNNLCSGRTSLFTDITITF